MFCPKCGAEVRPENVYCGKCGAKLRSNTVNKPKVIDLPNPSASPVADTKPEDSWSPQADMPDTTQPDISVAQEPTARPNRSRLIIVIAACIALLAIGVLVFFALSKNSPAPPNNDTGGEPTVVEGAQPAVVDKQSGKTITALARPVLVTPTKVDSSIVKAFNPTDIAVEPGFANVINNKKIPDYIQSTIGQYGFCVTNLGGLEFFELYEFNRYGSMPNFVTVDSLMHTYHLYYQYLQKNVERDYLAPTLAGMSKQLLEASDAQYQSLKGTEWESAAMRNVAFFGVGAQLQDPSVSIPEYAKDIVSTEAANIQAASTMGTSAITQDQEDYTQYRPRSYYAGNEILEQYFRTMMWYGRINFTQKDEDLDRSALLMTMALQGETQQRWEAIYIVTSFFAGASDDCGYYEYKPLLDAAYGADATTSSLVGNADAWTHYHELTATMPAPQINSIPLASDESSASGNRLDKKGWRLMGQRFSLDAMVFQNLVHDRVGKNASGDKRTLPDALDVPAAMGSDEALNILESRGATAYEGYSDNMDKLRTTLANDEDERWNASLYGQWLYTIKPLLSQKDENYPSFMRSSQWARKSLQSYLGSFTELKHDSALYSKQVLSEGGGGVPPEDDRGYVEPEPVVFARLANLTNATMEGLARYNLLSENDRTNLDLLRQLADKLSVIATKELQGELPTDEEFELIRSYGEQLEHFWQEVYKNESTGKYLTTSEFPAAIVADIATDGDNGTVLEVGTGRVFAIYVIVPVGGSLRVASGTTFSFYQFEQPASQRLTDAEWRAMMGIQAGDDGKYSSENAKDLEDWTQDFTVERK